MTVEKFTPKKKPNVSAGVKPRPAAAPPLEHKPLGCACEDLPIGGGVFHVTARCREHATPPAPNTSRFHVDRDLVAALNADLALVDVANSDRGVHSMTIFCAHVMAAMRLIDSAPRTEFLSRLHRECEVVLTSLLELPRMDTPQKTQGAPE